MKLTLNESPEIQTNSVCFKINSHFWIRSTSIKLYCHMFYRTEMEEYKEFLLVFFNSISLFSSIFWVKPVAEIIVFGSLRICYINLMAKFDLFILVELCTSSIIFQNKIKGPRRKNVHRLDRANSYLWKAFLWRWLTLHFHVFYRSLITLNMEGW